MKEATKNLPSKGPVDASIKTADESKEKIKNLKRLIYSVGKNYFTLHEKPYFLFPNVLKR